MSLTDLTRNSFQSGISAPKWVKLCQLYLSKNAIESTPDTEHQISNSVLLLYRSYPGEPDLVDYFRHALKEGLVSLPIFVSTFLQAAWSPEIQTSASLDMLCRVALDAHYSSNLPPIGSVVPFNAASATIVATVKDALALLRSARSLPPSHFHQLSTSAAELATLLISCITDLSQIPVSQALLQLSEVREILQSTFPLSETAKTILQNYAISLEAVVGDDVKAAQEAQIMQSVSISTYGKGDFIESTSYSDIVSFSLLLSHLVHHRGAKHGAGSGNDPLISLLGILRLSSWTPTVFYTQLLSSAFAALSQSSGMGTWIWISFIAGRLPPLISQFEAIVKSDASMNADLRNALQSSLSTVLRRSEPMTSCDILVNQAFEAFTDTPAPRRSASREFLAGLIHQGLVDTSFAVGIDVMIADDKVPRLSLEARDAGQPDLQAYFILKVSPDANLDDTRSLLGRVWLDPTSHASFAHAILEQAARLTASLEVEPMSLLCKILLISDTSLDIVSLHQPISQLVYYALRFIDLYDCETVGDPQTAVAHLGHVVLFAQYTMAKYNLNADTFSLGAGTVSSQSIKAVWTVHSVEELSREDIVVYQSWFKTLFDSSSEGIEDSILRSTNPKTLLRLAASLISHAIVARQVQKIDNDVFHNGVSFFLSPLLNWTLVGVVKSLMREIRIKGFNAAYHIDVLQTILLSPSCPRPVICLCGSHILTMFTKLSPWVMKASQTFKFNVDAVRQVAANAIGYTEPANPPTPQQQAIVVTQLGNQPKLAILSALALARAGKAPQLDVEQCLLVATPAKFLQLLWSELLAAAGLGETEACRRIATFVLAMPRSPSTPPLLPIFLYIVLPALIASIDKQAMGEPPLSVELLFNIITSSLTAALHLEWALRTVGGESSYPLGGQPSTIMARRLGMNLRMKKQSYTSSLLAQKLAASQPFMTNFPHFTSE